MGKEHAFHYFKEYISRKKVPGKKSCLQYISEQGLDVPKWETEKFNI